MTQNYYEWTERYLNSEASNNEIDGDNIDSNSSIPAASFDLPSGGSIEENEDGEVIITDSGGTTIARRDETNNQWVFDSIVSNTLEATTISQDGHEVATLNESGVLKKTQLPKISLNEVIVTSNQNGRLSVESEENVNLVEGDVVIETYPNPDEAYIYANAVGDSTDPEDWILLSFNDIPINILQQTRSEFAQSIDEGILNPNELVFTNIIVDDNTIMSEVVSSNTAMNDISTSTTAMNSVSSSTVAKDLIGTSGDAYNIILGVEMAIGKYIAGLANLNPSNYADIDNVVSDQTAMETIADDTDVMNAVASSDDLFGRVTSTTTAIDVVTSSQNAMEVVTSLVSATTEVLNQTYTLNKIWKSNIPSEKIIKYGEPEVPTGLGFSVSADIINNQYNNGKALRIECNGGDTGIITYTFDYTNISQLSIQTNIDQNNQEQDVFIKLGGNQLYKTNSASGWTTRTFDVSSYSGEVDLELGVQSSTFASNGTTIAKFSAIQLE